MTCRFSSALSLRGVAGYAFRTPIGRPPDYAQAKVDFGTVFESSLDQQPLFRRGLRLGLT